jgi:hypothetical protein
VRALLKFLDAHPPLAHGAVVIVGESYGGMRATLMLNMLLHSDQYGAGNFVDPELAPLVHAHFGIAAGATLSPSTVAQQFGHAVLIQPGINTQQFMITNTMRSDPDSPWSQLGAEINKRDISKYDEMNGWGQANEQSLDSTMEDSTQLTRLWRVPLASVNGLTGASRENAFRYQQLPNPTPSPEPLASSLGALPAWDAYYMENNGYFGLGDYGTQFLQDLVDVKILITQAKLDLVVYSPSIPAMFKTLTSQIDSVDIDQAARSGVDRPGWFTLHYHSGLFGVPDGTTRTIRWPVYSKAGHMVALSQGADLLADVRSWYAEP